MKTYVVRVKEVWITYSDPIEAESADTAIEMVKNQRYAGLFCGDESQDEYSHDLPSSTWDVEEQEITKGDKE